ncbi:hypothetical protein [Crenothrix sp.]|uniref:hypothetical protein n=1 Tax=Crenothrix sp. TaxID=3100433 RepID=UPI00374DE0D0
MIKKRFLLTSTSLCLALTASSLLYSSAASAKDSYEVTTLKSLYPFISQWDQAIAKKNIAKAKKASKEYEAKWQGLEVYVNYRSIPLYRDMEVDTQFAIDKELAKDKPNFPLLRKQAAHLKEDLNAAIQMAKAPPKLSTLFDHLVPLRGLRSKSLYVARDALNPASLNLTQAKASLTRFKQGFPAVAHLIDARSTTAGDDIETTLANAEKVFSKPNATVEDMTQALNKLITRYGFGVGLVNAAARTSNLKKLAITEADKDNLTKLNAISLALAKNAPATSALTVLQPTLEAFGRYINAIGPLRTALAEYDKGNSAETKKAALEAVATTQQVLVGQFWGKPELRGFLKSLPKK